jgi:O-antigen/teichoic acid export membrane protein
MEPTLPNSLFSRFVRGVFSIGLGKFSTMTLGLLAVMVITRHLLAADYGTFVLIQVFVTFLVRFSSFGLGLAAPKFIASASEQTEKRRLINTLIYFRFFTTPLVIILAVVVQPVLTGLFDVPLLMKLFTFVTILYSLQSLDAVFKPILQGLFLFRKAAFAEFISSALNFLFLCLFVLFLKLGLLGLLYAKVFSLVVGCIYAYFAIPISKKLEFRSSILKPVLKFGFPLQLNDILTYVYLRIDTFMLGALLGPAAIAYYEIARKIPESLTGLYEAFRIVYFPFVAKFFAAKEPNKAAKMLNHATRLISFATMLGTLLAFIFGNQIISLMFSEKYLESVPAFFLLMVWLNLAFTDYTLGYSLVAVGDSEKPVMINIVHTVVCVIGNLLLIRRLGITGAALSSVLGFVATNPIYVFFLKRRNVETSVMAYLKPILIFGVCWLLIAVLEPINLLHKILVVVLFIMVSAMLSVITASDFMALSREAKMTLNGAFIKLR